MQIYRAPLRDMRFILHEVFGLDGLRRIERHADLEEELADAVLGEAARFCETVLLPLNQPGDAQGCQIVDGAVVTPDGLRDAYRAFAEGGWPGMVCDPGHGGQGLPHTLHTFVEEMICSTNLAFGTVPGLSSGACEAIAAYGDQDLRATYLPRLASGAWTGTMCLTEPQCGTDLGLVRTRAVPDGDGYRLTGNKIFITAGEHDLAENIVHLVLARLPDAPEGIRGISLFLVPRRVPDGDGRPGAPNGVSCTALEEKMGLHASPTCAMAFEDARGWLLGEPHRGVRQMFTMMNAARLAVGIQGLGLAETAYQSAVAYAKERLQGRSLAGPSRPDAAADPIIVHPDVRRMLLTIRARTEAARALACWISLALDRERGDPDPESRAEAADLVALMTPVFKAHVTDLGFEAANLGVQVLGGHGYIRESGLEQLVRDARIAQIYEGTNGIQALDLVGRKLPRDYGRLLRPFFHPLSAFLEQHGGDATLREFTGPLAKAFGRLQQATLTLAERGVADPEEAAAGATEYLRLMGLTASAWMWARMAKVAAARLEAGTDEAGFYEAKLATGRFFVQRLLPETGALLAAIMAGKSNLMALPEDAF